MMEYRIQTNDWIYYPSPYLTQDIYGSSQYYVQINNALYIYNSAFFANITATPYISVFNLTTKSFTRKIQVKWDTDQQRTACIAGNKEHIFLMGGSDYIGDLEAESYFEATNVTYILNIANNSWLYASNVLQMNRKRQKCASIINEEYDLLYVIGGYDYYFDNISRRTYETLYIGDMENVFELYNWELNLNEFEDDLDDARAVVFGQDIIVLGGINWFNLANKMFIINGKDGSISSYFFNNHESLEVDTIVVGRSCPIIVNDILYRFGGTYLDQNSTIPWEYLVLLSKYLYIKIL